MQNLDINLTCKCLNLGQVVRTWGTLPYFLVFNICVYCVGPIHRWWVRGDDQQREEQHQPRHLQSGRGAVHPPPRGTQAGHNTEPNRYS